MHYVSNRHIENYATSNVIFRVLMAFDGGLAEYGYFSTHSAAVESVHGMARPILDAYPGSSMCQIAPEEAKDGLTFVVRTNDRTVIGQFGIIVRPGRGLFKPR